MKTMFKCLILSAVTLGASFESLAETRSIDFPYFETNNSRSLEILRVEAGADTTYVFADLYSRPGYWVKISSASYLKGNNSGKIYRLIGTEGIETDKEVYPGNDWRVPFVMKFEVLDSGDTGFDYIEGESQGAFKVTGVSLDHPQTSGSVTCRLEGTVSNPEFGRLILSEFDVDFRTGKTYSIPVDSGRFVYDFHCEPDRIYSIVPFNEYLNGGWMICDFYTCDGTVRFDIQDEKRIVKGESDEQKKDDEFRAFGNKWHEDNMRDIYELRQNKEVMYTPEFDIMVEKMKNAQGEERNILVSKFNPEDYLTEKGKAIIAKGDSLMSVYSTECASYFIQHPSLAGIKYVLDQLQRTRAKDNEKQIAIDLYENNLKNYRPDHVYHDKVNMAIAAYKLKPGKKYIDYELADGKGGKVRISELIDGHLTLIDLWASWCGPCRRNAKSVIPVYEKYKDKGFQVIGIAREAQDENMQAAIDHDGYPWPNYLELNDENKIWQLNGLGNAGGGTFLVDSDGTIIMLNPTADDLETILDAKLNKK